MTVLSLLRGVAPAAIASRIPNGIGRARKMSDHRTMIITPSRFQWNKFKDMLHLYTVGTAGPLLFGIFVLNCTVGPATLTELPDPDERVIEEWEYFKSPITRFLVRYCTPGQQMQYEKKMQYIWETEHKRQLRLIETKVRDLMSQRGDYKAWYFVPDAQRKYQRIVRKDAIEMMERRGASATER